MKKKVQHAPYEMKSETLNRMIEELVGESGATEDADLIKQLIVTALKVGQEEMQRADIKMLNTALKELRYAFKVFYPYRHVRKVAIFGSARASRKSPEFHLAKEFAHRIVQDGWMVITGASYGIMNAGNEGAGRANSFGVNIRLPFEQDANPVIQNDPKLISFKYFFTRKLIFVHESSATVLCPGGFGTHDEGFESLTLIQTGKADPRPLVCLDPVGSTYWKHFRDFLRKQMVRYGWIDPHDIELMYFTHDAEEAVKYISRFYRNYHSMRYIDDKLVMRIKKPLSEKKLDQINANFGDIVRKGKILQQTKPFAEEQNEPRTFDLSRLAFYYDRRHFARLHQLIHSINDE